MTVKQKEPVYQYGYLAMTHVKEMLGGGKRGKSGNSKAKSGKGGKAGGEDEGDRWFM